MKRMKLTLLLIFIGTSAFAGEYGAYSIVSSCTMTSETYKNAGGTNLQAYIFTPDNMQPDARRPAIVFFHGGGWFQGKASGFFRRCKRFAERGWVAISIEYRLSDMEEINPVHCIMDAKSAIRWIRKNAERLRINPDRLVAVGQSAGGHLALCTALIPKINDNQDDIGVSSVPDAIICYSACYDPRKDSHFARIMPRGYDISKTSPFRNIYRNTPPVLMFHTTKDETVDYRQASDFHTAMQKMGNQCELITFNEGGHVLLRTYDRIIHKIEEDFLLRKGFEIK